MIIYKFWVNEKNLIIPTIKNIEEFNKFSKTNKIIVGPSYTENFFLIKNFEIYKKFFDEKKYVFCSDIYRFWKASQSKEIMCYADATIEFEVKKFDNFLNKLENEKTNFLILESPMIFWSGFFVCSNLQNVFKLLLQNNYMKGKIKCSAPIMLTDIIRKKFKSEDLKFAIGTSEKYEKINTQIETINFLRFESFNPNSFIKINPMATWRKKDSKNIWIKKNSEFNSKKLKFRDYFFLKLPKFIQRFFLK